MHVDILSGILSGIPSDIYSDIFSDIFSGIFSNIPCSVFGIFSGMCAGPHVPRLELDSPEVRALRALSLQGSGRCVPTMNFWHLFSPGPYKGRKRGEKEEGNEKEGKEKLEELYLCSKPSTARRGTATIANMQGYYCRPGRCGDNHEANNMLVSKDTRIQTPIVAILFSILIIG